ncbi:hypothetical protein BDW71DRAFT_177798 [Aspergillus fruticulosus]
MPYWVTLGRLCVSMSLSAFQQRCLRPTVYVFALLPRTLIYDTVRRKTLPSYASFRSVPLSWSKPHEYGDSVTVTFAANTRKVISVMSRRQCRPACIWLVNADQRLSLLLEEPFNSGCAARVRSPTSCASLVARVSKGSAKADSDTT